MYIIKAVLNLFYQFRELTSLIAFDFTSLAGSVVTAVFSDQNIVVGYSAYGVCGITFIKILFTAYIMWKSRITNDGALQRIEGALIDIKNSLSTNNALMLELIQTMNRRFDDLDRKFDSVLQQQPVPPILLPQIDRDARTSDSNVGYTHTLHRRH
jgi:hypothetical protein